MVFEPFLSKYAAFGAIPSPDSSHVAISANGDKLFTVYEGSNTYMGPRGHGIVEWSHNPEFLRDLACELVNRNFTESEWIQYFGSRRYGETCNQVGAGESALNWIQADFITGK